MSFRNYSLNPDSNIRIDEGQSGSLLMHSNFSNPSANKLEEEVLRKISGLIVALHEGYLAKCQNIQIYRDLAQDEQRLLTTVDKNSPLHTALAGVLAVDSCVKCIDKQEYYIMGNVIRGLSILLGNYKILEKEIIRKGNPLQECFVKFVDSLKYLLHQIHSFPLAKGREAEFQRQKKMLEYQQVDQELQEWHCSQEKQALSEVLKESQMLKIAIKQKEGYIGLLEGRLSKVTRTQKNQQEKRTSHSLANRVNTQKSSQNESQGTIQQYYQQITRLKEELLEKNNIVIKMNEQFASQMEKYNSVFKRLEEQNKLLKKYNDIDTTCLLQELEYQIDILRDQKRKDQLIISDIQRKIQGISFSRNSRIQSRNIPIYESRYNRQYEGSYLQHQEPDYSRRSNINRYGKYYSPNYSGNRVSPYANQRGLKDEILMHYPQEYKGRYQKGRPSQECRPIKSRSRYTGMGKEREEGKSPNINLFERVMSKHL